MKQQVSLEIMEFVERQILPRYNAFGESHGLRHVTRVIKNSLRLADVTGADIDMVYVIAAYHDLGMEGPRAIHHLTSGKILMADARLKKWFNADQLKVMKEAVAEVASRGEPIDVKVRDFLKVRRKDTCPRCGSKLRTAGVKGMDAWFCPTCQPATRKGLVDWTRTAK